MKKIKDFIIIFTIISFIVSSSMFIFFNGLIYYDNDIKINALNTFFHVLFISITFSILDQIRKSRTIRKPVNSILTGLKNITNGDFTTSIETTNQGFIKEEFYEIITYINRLARELQSVETLRTDFISNVSHELKTPLSVIQNYSLLLQDENISDEEKISYAKDIENVTKNLASQISNILKLNKLENQSISLKKEEYNLNEQIRECILNFENEYESKNIKLIIDFNNDIYIKSDKELLSIIWNNLISNAIKFTPNNGTIEIVITSDNKDAIIKFIDSGIGMDKKVGKHIFDKFYQGNTSHSDKGNGLGLALVKRVITILDSEISVHSELKKGSTFKINLRDVIV